MSGPGAYQSSYVRAYLCYVRKSQSGSLCGLKREIAVRTVRRRIELDIIIIYVVDDEIYDRPNQNVEIFDIDLFSVIYTAL